ncbi:MAG: isocitrate/isopropylmalate dehydrogenase family protein [Elusimicrobiota bacterium]|nr:isocitrate/isopropylmalate dehydrogenase family protein [Elusimicrobiota bacterium]
MDKKYRITLISGDGIGPEITAATRLVLSATDVKIEWEEVVCGEEAMKKYKTPLPENVLESIKKNKVALKGPLSTPIGTGFRSVNVALRRELNLYACIRPAKSMKGIKSKFENIDLVVVRENTEDLYAGIEYFKNSSEANKIIDFCNGEIRKDSAISIKPISESATKKIVTYAFEYAMKNNRKKVTAITKANIMKATDGLFYEVAKEVAKKYPNIEYNERLIDNMCMQLVQKPEIYDVLVLPNLYGDIISDLCAGLIGGLGVAPGANIGEDSALFEAVHGSAPKYKGLNKVNPTALILSAAMMLEYIGEKKASQKVKNAVEKVIREGKNTTYDLGGTANTMQYAESVAKFV